MIHTHGIRETHRQHPFLAAILVLAVMLQPVGCMAEQRGSAEAAEAASRQRVSIACRWLRGQQDPRTGLLRSYNPSCDDAAATYDQAVAIISFLLIGDTASAIRSADTMLRLSDAAHHVWPDGYDAATAEVRAGAIAVGPAAWMGLALLRLYQATKQDEYLAAANQVADFILGLQTSGGAGDGSIAGGYDESGKPFTWTSTEHNADSMAFLAAMARTTGQQRFRDAAIRITRWLDREMWDPAAGCYNPGYADNATGKVSQFPERLDSQTWVILALDSAKAIIGQPKEISRLMHNGLPWIDRYCCRTTDGSEQLVGFAKITLGDRATPSFWSEGTAGYCLAARRADYQKPWLAESPKSLRRVQRTDGSLPHSIGVSIPDLVKQLAVEDLLISHFEGHPNCLCGAASVYGDGEPDWDAIQAAGFEQPYSWYYEPGKPAYDKINVHTGWQSFRLVNAGSMCRSQTQGWASLGMDLGPVLDETGKTRPLDARNYRALAFWAKTDNENGANLKVFFRDAHASSLMPQVTVAPNPPTVTGQWQRFMVDLETIGNHVDLEALVHAGVAFGADVGNPPGTVLYLDDMAFLARKPLTTGGGAEMPAVFPQHWPAGSVAATSWFIFAELDINPFACDAGAPGTRKAPAGNPE
jgi:hypothetical protein